MLSPACVIAICAIGVFAYFFAFNAFFRDLVTDCTFDLLVTTVVFLILACTREWTNLEMLGLAVIYFKALSALFARRYRMLTEALVKPDPVEKEKPKVDGPEVPNTTNVAPVPKHKVYVPLPRQKVFVPLPKQKVIKPLANKAIVAPPTKQAVVVPPPAPQSPAETDMNPTDVDVDALVAQHSAKRKAAVMRVADLLDDRNTIVNTVVAESWMYRAQERERMDSLLGKRERDDDSEFYDAQEHWDTDPEADIRSPAKRTRQEASKSPGSILKVRFNSEERKGK